MTIYYIKTDIILEEKAIFSKNNLIDTLNFLIKIKENIKKAAGQEINIFKYSNIISRISLKVIILFN